MAKYDIAIIGGDKRTACMAPIFQQLGYRTICYHTLQSSAKAARMMQNGNDTKALYHMHAKSLREAVDGVQLIVCGIPFTKGNNLYCEDNSFSISLYELQRCLRKRQKLFAGVIPDEFRRTCEEREINCYDFMKDEPLTLFNAVSTAEGAILEALIHKATNIHHSSALVMGYGRCGKVLADKLKGLSAKVTVSSNDEKELSMAAALGFSTMHTSLLTQKIKHFEYVFNTIPACLLNKVCLKNTSKNTLIIDIASNKTGADYEAASLMDIDILYCPGLPGKYSSEACAQRLVEYTLQKSGLKLCD